ncbi:MAG: RNA 2',3'-cyclic phosphodiesterase [Candidatus Staskawiczbacteria bacterium]|nr:RNA 2',3'-cyclic phosphodiesterase [Candidatus Staskawiczbacteria bacterium]
MKIRLNMIKKHRIFIAINLPEDIKNKLAFYSKKWPELPCKWIKKENLHITLEFLGHLTDQELADVCLVVEDVSKRHSSFAINLTGISYGPKGKMPPRMVWAEGEKSDGLVLLKKDLQENLSEKINFNAERKGFVPHVTLARIKEWEFRRIDIEEIPEINENVEILFSVESIEVMASELKRGGPVYAILESRNLM